MCRSMERWLKPCNYFVIKTQSCGWNPHENAYYRCCVEQVGEFYEIFALAATRQCFWWRRLKDSNQQKQYTFASEVISIFSCSILRHQFSAWKRDFFLHQSELLMQGGFIAIWSIFSCGWSQFRSKISEILRKAAFSNERDINFSQENLHFLQNTGHFPFENRVYLEKKKIFLESNIGSLSPI